MVYLVLFLEVSVFEVSLKLKIVSISESDYELKLCIQFQKSPDKYGAFCSWKVVLVCDPNKEDNYKRLLKAGGATVLNIKPPYTGHVDATHALLETRKVEIHQEDLEILLKSGCLCLKAEYISGFLCFPEVDVTKYVPPEIAALQAV